MNQHKGARAVAIMLTLSSAMFMTAPAYAAAAPAKSTGAAVKISRSASQTTKAKTAKKSSKKTTKKSSKKTKNKKPAKKKAKKQTGKTNKAVKKSTGTGLKDYNGKYYTGDSDGFVCIGKSMYAQFSSIDHSLPTSSYDARKLRLTRWKWIDGKLTLLDDTNKVPAFTKLRFHHPNDLTTDGKYLYMADVSKRIWKIDASGVFNIKNPVMPQEIDMNSPEKMRISSITYDKSSKTFLICKTAAKSDTIQKQPDGDAIDLGDFTYYVCKIQNNASGTPEMVPYNEKPFFDDTNSFTLSFRVDKPSQYLSDLVGNEQYLSIYQSGAYYENGTLYSGLCIKKLDDDNSGHSTAINASVIMTTAGVAIGPDSIIFNPVQECTALRDPNAKAKVKKSFELEGLCKYYGSSSKGAMYGIVREKDNTENGPGVRNNIYDFSSGSGMKYRAASKNQQN
ncbi:MAG: hypothetical protein ACFNYI_05005 [Eubacterium sp.]